jgi:hypothetical protein
MKSKGPYTIVEIDCVLIPHVTVGLVLQQLGSLDRSGGNNGTHGLSILLEFMDLLPMSTVRDRLLKKVGMYPSSWTNFLPMILNMLNAG